MRNLIDLLESAEHDIADDKAARECYNRLWKEIEKNAERKNLVDSYIDHKAKFFVKFKLLSIDQDMTVLGNTNPLVHKNYSIITIFIPEEVTNRSIYLWMGGLHGFRTFMHEFRHHVDLSQNTGLLAYTVKNYNSADPIAYANNAAEFNAHFHNMATPMFDVVQLLLRGYKLPVSDFAIFKNEIFTEHATYIENLTPEYKKKLIKRLYMVYHAMKTTEAADLENRSEPERKSFGARLFDKLKKALALT